VCELCTDRAYNEGWIRESAHDEMPATTRRPDQRRGVFGRLRRKRGAGADPLVEEAEAPVEFVESAEVAEPVYEEEPVVAEAQPEPWAPPPRQRRRDARHVRAVPTNAQVKVERALELFNGSEHVRTIAGIAKTLGEPWVSSAPLAEAPAEVSIVVAWELSWYRFRVDLGDADDPVTLVAKGQELDELDESMRDWNSTALPDGRLAVGVAS
jgi:hypothetical protein